MLTFFRNVRKLLSLASSIESVETSKDGSVKVLYKSHVIQLSNGHQIRSSVNGVAMDSFKFISQNPAFGLEELNTKQKIFDTLNLDNQTQLLPIKLADESFNTQTKLLDHLNKQHALNSSTTKCC
jgi:hypothetical protein